MVSIKFTFPILSMYRAVVVRIETGRENERSVSGEMRGVTTSIERKNQYSKNQCIVRHGIIPNPIEHERLVGKSQSRLCQA